MLLHSEFLTCLNFNYIFIFYLYIYICFIVFLKKCTAVFIVYVIKYLF